MIPANNHPEIDRLIHLKKHPGGMTMSKLISCQFNIDTACVAIGKGFLIWLSSLISRKKAFFTRNPVGIKNDTVYGERYQIVIKREI